MNYFPSELIKTEIPESQTMFNLIQYADKVASTLRYCIEEIPQAKDRKIFIYYLPLHNVFPFKKKSNFIYFDDKNLFGENVT